MGWPERVGDHCRAARATLPRPPVTGSPLRHGDEGKHGLSQAQYEVSYTVSFQEGVVKRIAGCLLNEIIKVESVVGGEDSP